MRTIWSRNKTFPWSSHTSSFTLGTSPLLLRRWKCKDVPGIWTAWAMALWKAVFRVGHSVVIWWDEGYTSGSEREHQENKVEGALKFPGNILDDFVTVAEISVSHVTKKKNLKPLAKHHCNYRTELKAYSLSFLPIFTMSSPHPSPPLFSFYFLDLFIWKA